MNPAKLRIGNLFRDKFNQDTIMEVYKLDHNIHFSNVFSESRKWQAEPIPLTDKWAIKFGYECLVEMACDFTCKSKYNIEITSKDLELLNVHEAQNLHFELTGDELGLTK